jgi:coproporphyrinogen III oxidase
MAEQSTGQALPVARVREYLTGLQARITEALEQVEGEGGARFLSDAWSKGPGERLQGDGITRIMEGGRVFERAGCGFSHVRGPHCRPRPRSTGLNWRVRRSRPWACPWSSIRAILLCPRYT